MASNSNSNNNDVGLSFPNGCRITHGAGATIKHPFPSLMPDLTMHELSPSNAKGFKGQLGFIEFTPSIRLPRHIHMTPDRTRLLDERILVLHGVGMVEIAGEIWVTAAGTLADLVGGVPHTWTACPAGVRLADGSVSEGRFTMVYEYEEPTSFFPTASTEVVRDVGEYVAWDGEGKGHEEIRFPQLSKDEVVERARCVVDKEVCKLTLA